jgi:hypothetical protein
MRWGDIKPKLIEHFPARVQWHAVTATIVSIDITGRAYVCDDGGLIGLDVEILEDSPEPARISRESTTIESQPTGAPSWVRRGFFKYGLPARSDVILRRDNARNWLKAQLARGPKTASAILSLGAVCGYSQESLRRAKKYHRIQAIRFRKARSLFTEPEEEKPGL